MDDEFVKLVERCAAKLENQMIFNASRDHALFLYQKLFEVAERTKEPVKIFSRKFEPDFYDKLVTNIGTLLDKNIPVSLISECPVSELVNNKFVNAVKNHQNGKFKARSMVDANSLHFILVNGSRYRYETDPNTMSARANFADPVAGSIIENQFNQMWATATS